MVWYDGLNAQTSEPLPSPVWERGRGEGRTVQEETLRLALLTTGFALFGEGLPSPLALSHSGEGEWLSRPSRSSLKSAV